MKKHIFILVLVVGWLLSASYHTDVYALADWWERPDVRPTQPSYERVLPTEVVPPTAVPTTPPVQPTSTVTIAPSPTNPVGPVSPTIAPSPTNPPTGGTPPTGNAGGSVTDDPCASGKSYFGPYCGWSPEVGKGGSTGGGNTASPRVGGPQVLGLSNTSGSETSMSDIILLAGVLCLLLYAKSKIELDRKLI